MPDATPTPAAAGSPRTCCAAPGSAPSDWLAPLGLAAGGPAAVLVLAGGDDAMADALRPRLTQVVARGLVRTLRDLAGPDGRGPLCITRACGDLPALLAQAQRDLGGPTALLGVAPADAPDAPVSGLTHLLQTPGDGWGDAVRAKGDLAAAAAGSAGRVLLLVVGGGEGTVAEVLAAVRRGWSVLLLEGSGGVADDLVRQARANQADGDDPAVAEVLADGDLQWVSLGDKTAVAVEALARLLQRAAGGDSVLRQAWQRFATLDGAAMRQQKESNTLQGWILVLGVVAVAISVARTVARNRPGWELLAGALDYALIAAPVFVSMLITIAHRFAPGKRFVKLRSNAEAIKREIYRYRVRPLGAVNDGGREKALQQALEKITNQLGTDANSIGLPTYTGPLPPPDAVERGDDGLRLLSAPHYLRLRLRSQLNWYRGKTVKLEREVRKWQMVAIVAGAVSALLAALAGPWGDWVALASAVAASALAFVSYKQFDTTLTGYNQSATHLENLLAWWTALRADEQADDEKVTALVTVAEQVMADEQATWTQNMDKALEALRTAPDQNIETLRQSGDPKLAFLKSEGFNAEGALVIGAGAAAALAAAAASAAPAAPAEAPATEPAATGESASGSTATGEGMPEAPAPASPEAGGAATDAAAAGDAEGGAETAAEASDDKADNSGADAPAPDAAAADPAAPKAGR